MSEPDYDDPKVEEQWCTEMREQVVHYLSAEKVPHGQVGEWPAWHAAPMVSIWAIESSVEPGWVGLWVIAGDLPTDYCSAETIKHPRDALRAIVGRWREYAAAIRSGSDAKDMEVQGLEDNPEEMLPMLESRAATLARWAEDDSIWEDL